MLRLSSGPLLSMALLVPALPQPAWQDPSPHDVRFVVVDGNVSLEVLDWHGSGRPLILLAGGGNTAHVFDEFAPKLTAHGHVYGITRRGFGKSGFSTPEHAADRLRDDVLAVMDALKIDRAVLVGHSIAGAELSAVAGSHPERVAGLVYLEAGYPYAWDDGKGPTMEEFLQIRGPRPPSPADSPLPGFRSLQEREAEVSGIRMPEAELRQTWESTSDGRPTKMRTFPGSPMFMDIMTRAKRHTAIRVPSLVIFAIPHLPESWIGKSTDPAVPEAARAYYTAIDALTERQAKAFEAGVPAARVVRLPGAHHIFLSNERDVLREMSAFFARLGERAGDAVPVTRARSGSPGSRSRRRS